MDSKQLAKYVGQKIQYYRKKKKLTQKALGEKIGVKHNTVSDYERGVISPEQDTLFALSDVFEISIDELFPPKKNTTDELERALKMAQNNLDVKHIEFLNKLIEKTLTKEGEDRDKFLESIKFTIDYEERDQQ